MYDILNNHRVERIFSVGIQSESAVVYPVGAPLDMWENTQLPNRALIIVDVTDASIAGMLDLVVQDSMDATLFDTDFCTVETITAAGLYFIDVVDFERYLQLEATVTGETVIWGAYLVTFEDQRRPAHQSGTSCALTYGTGRKPKVAAT